FFFFQAEDGIRDGHVTGVQTCALPIFVEGLVEFLLVEMSVSTIVPGPGEGRLDLQGRAVIGDGPVKVPLAIMGDAAVVQGRGQADRKSACRERVENWGAAVGSKRLG